MSAIPFRLQPCENPTEASLDALTFGDPSLYEKLLTLNRVEILAETPQVRAGTIWYRIDKQYCFVEAVAIRQGMYPLVYKVLPQMMAAQLGFSFVGRYLSMTYGYATRSLVWDDRLIAENGARSFAWSYPGMTPIVKLTAIIAGSTRKPVLVNYDDDSAGAAADAALLGDTALANKLANVARLKVLTGAEGTRAGTIWYYRNGNYCFVIATAFRADAPAEAVKLAPLLAAQLFGCFFVGNYSSIPADIKDKALAWDRETSLPIPELAPISDRLSGVQDFIVTFDDVPAGNPNPDPDPYPDNCEDPNLHAGESGWSYDGCHWSYSEPPPDCPTYGTELSRETIDPIETGFDGQYWQVGNWCLVTYADGTCGSYQGYVNDYSGWPYGTLLGNYQDYNYYADGNGGYYQGEYTGSNSGGGDGGGGNNYPPAGTVIDSGGGQYTVNAGCGDWVVGDYGYTTYADGNGGSYTYGGVSYFSSGTLLGNCNDYNYYSNGSGSYYQGEYTGNNGGGGNSCPAYGTMILDQRDPVMVNAGCGDWQVGVSGAIQRADGNCGYYIEASSEYFPGMTYLGNCNGYNYYADGSGGYYQGEYTG